MRLLVLDGSQLLHSLVRRLVPEHVVVEVQERFENAVAVLVADPPDAVIVNIGPADLPWRHFKIFCQSHEPKIPVLFESCVHRSAEDAELGPLNHSASFLAKPYSAEELKREIDRLIQSARANRSHSNTGVG